MTTFNPYGSRTSVDSLIYDLANQFSETDRLVKQASDRKDREVSAISHITQSLVKCANDMSEDEPLLAKVDEILSFIGSEIISTAEQEDLPFANEEDVEMLESPPKELSWADEVGDAGDTDQQKGLAMLDAVIQRYSAGNNLSPIIKDFYDQAKASGKPFGQADEEALRSAVSSVIESLVDKAHIVAEQVLQAHNVKDAEIEAGNAANKVGIMLEARMENALELVFERLKKDNYSRRYNKVNQHLDKA